MRENSGVEREREVCSQNLHMSKILRCFIKFCDSASEMRARQVERGRQAGGGGLAEDFMAGKINEHLIGLVGSSSEAL